MIKFRCDDCGQKMGVPEKYAGRAVKCTKCGVAVNVPDLEPVDQPDLDASELVPMEAAEEAYDDYDLDNSLDDADDMLAQLGAPAEGEGIVAAPLAGAAAAGGSCPGCGAEVGATAVLCIQCGHNLKSGGKMKVKVSKERGEGGGGGINGRAIVSFMVGGIVASIGGFLWFIIALFGFELGVLAWGIGGLTGLTVAAIYQRYSTVMGIGAAVVALWGLMLGKGLIFLLATGITMVGGAMESFGEMAAEEAMNDPETFVYNYTDHMIEESLFEPELQAKVDAVLTEQADAFFIDWDEELLAEMEAAAEVRVEPMTQEDKQAFVDEYFSFTDDEMEDLDAWTATFSLWDLLWFPLALGTAFSVGRGKE